MPGATPFFFVDVFASDPLTGNPVTLVPDTEALDEPRMRAIAREFNRSETTFLVRPTLPGATWRLRSFTPAPVFGAVVDDRAELAASVWLEDAATGTAAGPLVASLVAFGRIAQGVPAIVENHRRVLMAGIAKSPRSRRPAWPSPSFSSITIICYR
jgi:predicted PhzF superfamily epimerase YddE/YHI9